MPTQYISNLRNKIKEEDLGYPLTKEEALKLLGLVEEYGDTLLRLAGGGSEMFRRNGTEVDPKACADKIQYRFDSAHRFIRDSITKEK